MSISIWSSRISRMNGSCKYLKLNHLTILLLNDMIFSKVQIYGYSSFLYFDQDKKFDGYIFQRGIQVQIEVSRPDPSFFKTESGSDQKTWNRMQSSGLRNYCKGRTVCREVMVKLLLHLTQLHYYISIFSLDVCTSVHCTLYSRLVGMIFS